MARGTCGRVRVRLRWRDFFSSMVIIPPSFVYVLKSGQCHAAVQRSEWMCRIVHASKPPYTSPFDTCLDYCLDRCCSCYYFVFCYRAEDQPQNVMIAQIVKLCFPEQLERRMRETEAEKAKYELCLPAFFYNVPMFPGETLSLHLFEPRYKLMMRRIIDTSRRYCTHRSR